MVQIMSLNEGQFFKMGNGKSLRIIYPEMGAKHLTLNHSIFEPGQEFPQHIHEVSDDIFIVLEGGVSLRCGQVYTPIFKGDAVFVPAGEVHGTVNTTNSEAKLISFQGPPDPALYCGVKDALVTGRVPKPSSSQTKILIRRLSEGDDFSFGKLLLKKVFHPNVGSRNLTLSLVELDADCDVAAHSYLNSESIWILLEGKVIFDFSGKKNPIRAGTVIFVPPRDVIAFLNIYNSKASLLNCVAPPELPALH
ncbi:MAG: cupin domain-containing protein [Candidatus Bathyarchaeia archaeon]